MLLPDAVKNAGLDAMAAVMPYASIHTSYPGASGTGEVATARKAVTWGAASAGHVQGSSPAFDIPAGTAPLWIGYWSASSGGTYRGCAPNQGASAAVPKPFACADDTTDVLACEDHGFSNGDSVVVWSVPVAGSSLPTGISEGTVYYVRDATTDTFKLAATSGGAAIDLTDEGHGQVQRIVVEGTFGAAGTFAVTAHHIYL